MTTAETACAALRSPAAPTWEQWLEFWSLRAVATYDGVVYVLQDGSEVLRERSGDWFHRAGEGEVWAR